MYLFYAVRFNSLISYETQRNVTYQNNCVKNFTVDVFTQSCAILNIVTDYYRLLHATFSATRVTVQQQDNMKWKSICTRKPKLSFPTTIVSLNNALL